MAEEGFTVRESDVWDTWMRYYGLSPVEGAHVQWKTYAVDELGFFDFIFLQED